MNQVLAGTQKTESRERSPSIPSRQPALHPWAGESPTSNIDSQVDRSQPPVVNPDSQQLAMPPPTGAAGSATPAESATVDARAPAESGTAATEDTQEATVQQVHQQQHQQLAPGPAEAATPPPVTPTAAVDSPPAETSPAAADAPAAPGSPVTSLFTGVSLAPNTSPVEGAPASGIDATQPPASRTAASSGDTQVAIPQPQLQWSAAPPTSPETASPAAPQDLTSAALGSMMELLQQNAGMAPHDALSSTTAPASGTPGSTAAGTPQKGLSAMWAEKVALATRPADIPRSKDWAYNGPCD